MEQNEFTSAMSLSAQFGPKWGLVADFVKGSCELYWIVKLVCWFCEMV